MSFFDPLSFVIGSGVGAALGAGGMFVYKKRLAPPDESAPTSEQPAPREFFSGQGQSRYEAELATFLRHRHLPYRQLALPDVLVEPRFLQGRPPVLALEEDEQGILIETDIYRVIPMLHQFPAMYASFYMDTISLIDFETGDPHIAILGVEGSGKSTALVILGLIALGEISLDDYRDEDKQYFGEEDLNLPEDVRERRRREREEVQEKAMRQLEQLQGKNDVESRDEEINFDEMFPIYAHVHDLDLNADHYGGKIDPAEPLVRALFRYISRTTAITSSPLIYKKLRGEKPCLLLIDGFDELLPSEQAPYLAWLGALREMYGQHFIITTGGATGYDPLINLGFAPTFIVPPNHQSIEKLLQRWLAAWTLPTPPEPELQSLRVDNRNRSILDLTMKIWATLQGNIYEPGRRGYYEQYVRHQIGEVEKGIEIARDLAAQWLDEGKLPSGLVLQQVIGRQLGVEIGTEEKGKAQKGQGKIEQILEQLAASDVLIKRPDGSLAFSHPVVGWYLAGETLQTANNQELTQLGGLANWHGALGFASAVVDLEPAVLQKVVNSKPDLLFTNMFAVVDWIPDAPNNLRWVGKILERLGAAVLAPNQFPAMREYAVAALVSSRDSTGGVVYILRNAIRSGNADLRRLGCLGLGAIGAEQAVHDIVQMLYDSETEVQLAAGLALGAIGTEDALRGMTEGLIQGDRRLRKAVAEAFAAIPGEGHAVLYDGVSESDLEIRRACLYGLARIPQTWAVLAIYRTMLEDSEFVVRLAGKEAFAQARQPRKRGPLKYPEPVAYEWLVEWAAQKGEAVPEGQGGRQILMRALQESPSKIRVEAAKALGSLAHVTATKALYNTLSDSDTAVRVAAFEALGRLSNRIGRPMPGF